MEAEEFADRFDQFFRENYQLGREEPTIHEDAEGISYSQRGAPLNDILSNELGADADVVDAIIEHLPDVSDRDISKGAEPFYDANSCYENVADIEKEKTYEQEYWLKTSPTDWWLDFCFNVQYKRRFSKTKEALDELFGDPLEYEGGGALNPIYTLCAPQIIFRARRLDHNLTAARLGNQPEVELCAPPRELATAGRMNVEFIPVFYGAFDELTAASELRPGISEELAIGKFVTQQDLRVFDFTVLSRSSPEDRKVKPNTRHEFIHQMEIEISRPVLQHEARREYLATQIVAEYLSEYFKCDAVIYRSSVRQSVEHRNIVFLPRTEGFVGNKSHILRYQSFIIREVVSVTYQLFEPPF